MIIKGSSSFGDFGIFTTEDISADTLIFSHDEWIEDEQFGWHILTPEQIFSLPEEERRLFLRYSYDVNFDAVIGTFDWKKARHISNFMNHCCSPNMWYDYNDNIQAKRDIKAGEELTIDYGNFIVTMDQDFICNCGSPDCRGIITRNDWLILLPEYRYHFPKFLHGAINEQINGMTMTA